jgi:monovalent cation:proton antiporter-2 (CPA2) family protein
MAADTYLIQAATYLGAAVVSVPVAQRLGLGSVLGYIVAGVAVGPAGLGLVTAGADVMHVAEFGVVMMLFLIGLELQPLKLWQMRLAVFGLGGAQLGLTAAAVAGAGVLLGQVWTVAVAVGLIVAMSSTAMVLQALAEKGLLKSPAGEASFAVLLFQDLAVIPVLAVLPLLAGPAAATADPAAAHSGALDALPGWAAALVVLAAVAGLVAAGRLVMRPLFLFLAMTRMREIFTATALLLVAGTAVLMQAVGLSPALGAFIAGVVLADSEFRHEIESDIEPFKGLLLGLFFIAVGAGLQLGLVARNALLLAGLVAGIVALKAAVVYALARLARLTRPDATTAAIALSQIGEFAFVLVGFAVQTTLLDDERGAVLTAAVALSMLTTPLLLMFAERWQRSPAAASDRPADAIAEHNRVIIAGFGRVGQIVARLLIARGIRVTVLEHDAEQIEALTRFGFKVHFGDARRHDLLAAAGAEDAALLVVATDDRAVTSEIVATARRNFPALKILARAYDRPHAYELEDDGADGVVRETFGSAVDMGSGALRILGVPAFEAERTGRIFRRHDQESYESLRSLRAESDRARYGLAFRERREMLAGVLARDVHTLKGVPGQSWDADPLREEARTAPDATPDGTATRNALAGASGAGGVTDGPTLDRPGTTGTAGPPTDDLAGA